MNPIDDRLARLLRAAAGATSADLSDSKPPFGFETRVLATLAGARKNAYGGLFSLVFRQALISAVAVLCLSVGFNYRTLFDFATVLHDPDVQIVRVTQATVDASVGFPR